MRLVTDNPNPLNVLGLRQLHWCPEHFTVIHVKLSKSSWITDDAMKKCERWIYNNLHEKFCISPTLKILNNEIVAAYAIGFDNPSEATYFSIGCPLLNSGLLELC